MMLLVVISLSIYQATTQTYRYRDILIREGDFFNSIRLSMGILERDFSLLFSPVTMNPLNTLTPQDPNDVSTVDPATGLPSAPPPVAPPDPTLEQLLNSELGEPTDHWLGVQDRTGIRASRFVGESDKLTFVTASHQRLYKNYPESDFAKVAYELREDKNEDAMEGTRVLYKIEDPNVFDDVEKKEKTARAYPLLPGVKALKFRFYRRDKKIWETKWDNTKEDQRGIYPDLLEVTIEVVAAGRQNFTGTFIFKPEGFFSGLESTL